MPNFFCFRPDCNRYFGCIPIQIALGVSLFVAVGTQYYASIFFLVYHVWWWFIALFVAVVAHSLLFAAIYTRRSLLFIPVIIYEGLFVLLMIGAAIWMIVDIINVEGSQIYKRCDPSNNIDDDCYNQTKTITGIHIAVFFGFAVLNIFVFDVFFRFRIYLGSGSHRPAVNVVTGGVVNGASCEPAPVPQRQNISDPAHATIYSPGNPYQPQPISPPTAPQPSPNVATTPAQPAFNPSYQPYPTVRGPVAPAYPNAPNQLQNMYEAPPAYSPSEEKY